MSNGRGVEVTGVDEVNAAFASLGKSLTNDVEPASKVAALAVEKASGFAPVFTGALSASYAVEERFVVNPLPYSIFVEYGTERMAAQYPVQRSMDEVEDKSIAIYDEWLSQQIKEVGFDATG